MAEIFKCDYSNEKAVEQYLTAMLFVVLNKVGLAD